MKKALRYEELLCAGRMERKENDQWSFLVNRPDGAWIARYFG